ncbi:MAG: hypothetical protein ACOC33_04130 [bacterium]
MKKNLLTIIKEEILKEYHQDLNNLTLQDLIDISLENTGHDNSIKPAFTNMFKNAYNKNGEKGVIDLFHQINGLEIYSGPRKGRYSFNPQVTPQDYEGKLEEKKSDT